MSWIHVGRVWTNGEPFLVIDAASRGGWRGADEDVYEELIVEQPVGEITIVVGPARAGLIGDGVVRDDSWIEAFRRADGAVAFVQAAGGDYRAALAAALAYPDAGDEQGGIIPVGSGELAVFSSASDGDGEESAPFVAARPGPVPEDHGWASGTEDAGLLLDTDGVTAYRFKARAYTKLAGSETSFARWLFLP